MKLTITKKTIGSIFQPYAVEVIKKGKDYFSIFASEAHLGSYIIANKQGIDCIGSVGGIMSTIWDAGKDAFWSIQEFYPVFDSTKAKIMYSVKNDIGQWEQYEVAQLPYVHRIAVFSEAGKKYLIACTLCESKDFIDDWSKPGSIYLGEIQDDPGKAVKLECIYTGIGKNHGLTQYGNSFLVSGHEGVFKVDFYNNPIQFSVEKILKSETSEAVFFDINGDSQDELITIQGFHGDKVNIYSKDKKEWEIINTIDIAFGHVLWVGNIFGEPCILVGNRAGDKDISLYVLAEGGRYVKERIIIDKNVGSTQIQVVNNKDAVYLFSANHAANEMARYSIH